MWSEIFPGESILICRLFLVAVLIGNVHVFMQSRALAQSEKSPKDEGSRVQPLESGFRSLRGMTFGLGVYSEMLTHRAKRDYEPSETGFTLLFTQKIRGIWSGSIQVRWNVWSPHERSSEKPNEIAPMSIFSKVEGSPHLFSFAPSFDRTVRLVSALGLGYIRYYEKREVPFHKTKQERGQIASTLGGGVRINLSDSLAIRLGAEWWRGLANANVSGIVYQVEAQVGDVRSL